VARRFAFVRFGKASDYRSLDADRGHVKFESVVASN
jgi:hypothetical protein